MLFFANRTFLRLFQDKWILQQINGAQESRDRHAHIKRGIFYFPVPILDLIFMFSDLRKPIFLKPYEHRTISQNLDQWMWRITKSTTTLVGYTKSLTCDH